MRLKKHCLRNDAAIIAAAFGMMCMSAVAVPIVCHTESGTLERSCIEEGAVRINGDIRSSPLYRGGPKEIEKTSFLMVVDCKKGISALQDRRGVNFAAGGNDKTSVIAALTSWICGAPKPKLDKGLRLY